MLAVKRKIVKRKKRGKTAGKEQISQLVNHEGKEKEEALDADTTKRIRNGKIGSNKTKAGIFIENSRCSRINGRGWRCNQQTLVGYSLCEHHLGKGRLMKSMSSLRGRQSVASRTPQTDMINENNHMSLESPLENVGDDQKPLIEAMKGHARKNIGSVKARSMSSLLGVNIAHGSSTSDIGGVAAGIDASNSESGASPIPG